MRNSLGEVSTTGLQRSPRPRATGRAFIAAMMRARNGRGTRTITNVILSCSSVMWRAQQLLRRCDNELC